MIVTRFIGASVAKMPGSVVQQLLGMRRRIRDFNLAHGLRTALLYTGGWFVQWHEGGEAAVERTWAISRSHSGHSHPRVVHRSEGAPTLAEPVQIAALVGPDKATDVARTLFEIEREQEQRELAPADIWRRFAAPPSGRFASFDTTAPHRSIAVVSEYSESVEVIKALSERCRVPMNYQRFAGPDLHIADAGAAYTDIPTGTRGRTRVQALSRHALPLGIARLSFARVDGVLLLLNRRTDSAAALAHAAAPFIAPLRPQPAVQPIPAGGAEHVQAVLDFAAQLHSRVGL